MLCCYGFALSKNRKKSTIKPFTDINKIHVYENKKRLKTVYPSEPLKIKVYDKSNFSDSDFCINCDELQYISSTGKEDDYSNDFNRMFCIRCIKYNYDTIAPWDNDDSSDSSSNSSGNNSD